jgi:hypothetical protein
MMQATFGHTIFSLALVLLAWIACVFIVLLVAGLIGPKWLKERMRRQVRWSWRDASLFMPMDPYKPGGDALKEGIDNFYPTKERVRNFLHFEIGKFLLLFGLVALLLVLYAISL